MANGIRVWGIEDDEYAKYCLVGDGARLMIAHGTAGAATVRGAALGGWALARVTARAATSSDELTATSVLPPVAGSFAEQRSIALSADGRQLAFVFASADGTRSLWIRRLSRLAATPVPNSKNAFAPFWSPDGRSLAFFADGYLSIVDENGEMRRVCPAARPVNGSWNRDGRIVFAHDRGISLVAMGKGECALIIPADGTVTGVAFLPDGRIAYSHGSQTNMDVADAAGKHVASLPIRTRTFAFDPAGYVFYQSATDLVAIDAQAIDFRTLSLEGAPHRITSGVRSQSGVHTFSLSSTGAFAFLPGTADRPYLVYDDVGRLIDTVRVDGTWTLAVRQDGAPVIAVGGSHTGIWMYDLAVNRATRLVNGDDGSMVGTGGGNYFPAFNRDGSRLVFAQVTRTKCCIVERERATGAERTVVEMPRLENAIRCWNPQDWSRDDRFILARRDSALDIIPLDNPKGVQSIARSGRMLDGKFSPDGRSIAFSSDETGRAEVYVQTIPVGTPTRVSSEGGRWPQWNSTGTTLTWMSPGGKVQRIAISRTGEASGVPQTLFLAWTWRRSTFDDNGCGFGMVGDGARYIVRQSPADIGLAYYQNWKAILRGADSSRTQR